MWIIAEMLHGTHGTHGTHGSAESTTLTCPISHICPIGPIISRSMYPWQSFLSRIQSSAKVEKEEVVYGICELLSILVIFNSSLNLVAVVKIKQEDGLAAR